MEEGGVRCEKEKCRSERVRGHAVAPYELGALDGPSSNSYEVGEAVPSRSVRSSAALGAARSASRMRCRSRSFRVLSLCSFLLEPIQRKRPLRRVLPEEEVEWEGTSKGSVRWRRTKMRRRAGGRRREIWTRRAAAGIEGNAVAWTRVSVETWVEAEAVVC